MVVASMIFFPSRDITSEPNDLGIRFEDLRLKTSDGAELHGWFLHAQSTKTQDETSQLTLLWLHGNAGKISGRISKAEGWVKRGVNVLLVDYRGYGKSSGKIDAEENLHHDAQAAWTWLRDVKGIPPNDMVLYGESIGSVPAIRLAAEALARALILEAPFTSTKEMTKIHYGGMVPDFMIKDFQMDNVSRIGGIQCPLFVIQGSEDEVVPIQMGKAIFEKAPDPKEMWIIEGGLHNDLPSRTGSQFVEKPLEFVQGH
jgi:uncharacterized protein